MMRLTVTAFILSVVAMPCTAWSDERSDRQTLEAASIVLMFAAHESGHLYYPSSDLGRVEGSGIQIMRSLKDRCSFRMFFPEFEHKPDIQIFFGNVGSRYDTTNYTRTLHPAGYYNLFIHSDDGGKLVCRGPGKGMMDCYTALPIEAVNEQDIDRILHDVSYLRNECVKPKPDVY